jgi:CheY-like chemotaxis protein
MRTLFEDGIAKAAQGLTTLEEVLRVVALSEPRESGTAAAPAQEPAVAVVADKIADTVADRPGMPQRAADNAGESEPNAGRRRVLVVEDSATIVTIVKYFLELEGFEVMVAENGLVGRDMAVRECPDVIISDVMMPGMSGVEMVKALRLNPRTANVRVLMLTSEASVESETEGLAAGADDYILKPVDPRRLAARVKALFTRSRPTAALP